MVEIEIYRIAGSETDAAGRGGDAAAVAYLRCDQGNEAAIGCSEVALVDHRAASTNSFELIFSSQEVGVRYTQ